jgi:hypothetical protein
LGWDSNLDAPWPAARQTAAVARQFPHMLFLKKQQTNPERADGKIEKKDGRCLRVKHAVQIISLNLFRI